LGSVQVHSGSRSDRAAISTLRRSAPACRLRAATSSSRSKTRAPMAWVTRLDE
jgi:hypothetical protein